MTINLPPEASEVIDRVDTMLVSVVGSTLHGIGIGSDDLDLMGVVVEPCEAITGLSQWDHLVWRSADSGERSGPDDVDLTLYGLKKFMRLATTGNPSVQSLLFAPENETLSNAFGVELRERSHLIVSYRCKGRYLGYLSGQRKRALTERSSGKGRREGRETKWASHMVRLGYQAVEVLSTGRLTLPMEPRQADVCKAIKRGEVSFEDALDLSHDLELQASEIKVDQSPLRPEPDLEALQDWMHTVYARRHGGV